MLCTLAQVRDEAKVPFDAVQPDDDRWITNNLIDLTARIETMTRQRFVPYYKLYHFDAFGPHIDDTLRKLDLNRPLLYPTKVIDAFDNDLVLNTDYVMVQEDSPVMQLQLISSIVYGWSYGFGFGTYFWIAPGQFIRKIKVWGVWGARSYGTDYPSGWTDTLQTITTSGGISSTATQFTVTDVDGTNALGYKPAISPGNVFQLGDSTTNDQTQYEWLRCVAVDRETNVVTVARGVNGSQARAWDQGTSILAWEVQPEINRAAYRWLGYWYSRRGAYEAVKTDLAQGKTMIYPSDAPTEILNTVHQTRDWGWSAV